MCACVHACMHTCMDVCMYACMHACWCIYVGSIYVGGFRVKRVYGLELYVYVDMYNYNHRPCFRAEATYIIFFSSMLTSRPMVPKAVVICTGRGFFETYRPIEVYPHQTHEPEINHKIQRPANIQPNTKKTKALETLTAETQGSCMFSGNSQFQERPHGTFTEI